MYLQRPPSRPEATPDPVPLALRAATLGVIAAVLLGVLLFRLWALQVLHSDQYVAAAAQNSVRTIDDAVAARRDPRPQRPRCSSRTPAAIAVQVDAARLLQGGVCLATLRGRSSRCRPRRRARVLKRLAWVLAVPYPHLWQRVRAAGEREPRLPGDAAVPRRSPHDGVRARAPQALRRRAVRAHVPAQLSDARASSARSTRT